MLDDVGLRQFAQIGGERVAVASGLDHQHGRQRVFLEHVERAGQVAHGAELFQPFLGRAHGDGGDVGALADAGGELACLRLGDLGLEENADLARLADAARETFDIAQRQTQAQRQRDRDRHHADRQAGGEGPAHQAAQA